MKKLAERIDREEEELDKQALLKAVRFIKDEYYIRLIPKKEVTNKMRRRISILVTEEYLKAGGGIHDAFFFEAYLYDNLKNESLNCEKLDIEIEEEQKKYKKRKGFNPLKLVSERYKITNKSKCITALALEIITELKKEAKKNDSRRHHTREGPIGGFSHQRPHTKKATGKRATIFQPE